MIFDGNSQEAFLINASMIGLGLLIAIYTISSPRITEILKRRKLKLSMLVKERENIFLAMKNNKSDEKLTNRYKEIQKKIKNCRNVPFHLDLGYNMSASFFAISLIIPILIFFDFIPKDVVNLSMWYFIFGIIILLWIWFAMFAEYRLYINKEFDKVSEKSEDIEKEESKEIHQWVNKIRNIEVILPKKRKK